MPMQAFTERELDVLRLIHDGKSNKQIAQQLSLSIHTVKDHTRRIYAKLGGATRADAAVWFERHYGSGESD